MDGSEFQILSHGFQFLQREPDQKEYVGEWISPGEPPSARHILNDLRKSNLYSMGTLKSAFRPNKYGNNLLLVGYGVENLLVRRGTVVLGGVWDCLGLLAQYEASNGDVFVRGAHIDMLRSYNDYSVYRFIESIIPDLPTHINFGVYGNERTIFSITKPGIPTLTRDPRDYENFIRNMIPSLGQCNIEVNMGAIQPEKMGCSTFAVASTNNLGDIGSRTFKLDTDDVRRTLNWR